MDTKRCTKCGETKPLVDFFLNGPGASAKSRCKKCESERAARYRVANKEHLEALQRKHTALRAQKRRNNQDTHQFIWVDSRRSDRKQGLVNDLDPEFIRDCIANGCSYCGETELRMTLDRIDNDKGHMQDNVVPACIRCNYARRSMPHAAWLLLVPGMRAAREQGLFGTWTGRVR